MKKSYISCIIIIAIFVAAFYFFDKFKTDKFEQKIEKLEKERKLLNEYYLGFQKTIDSLDTALTAEKGISSNLEEKIKQKNVKKDKAFDAVVGYDERKLDSILTNYKHPTRN